MWSRVLPLLAPHHDTVAFTALGHRGGRPAKPGVRIADLVDDAERTLDDLGLDRPHLAGNSMGGWLAIELARRGRAATVCALSPAGSWDEASGGQNPPAKAPRAVARLVPRTRRVLPLAARVPAVRRFALRDNAVHGERLSPKELVTMADDL